MSKKPINPEERKVKFTISINPKIFEALSKFQTNKSKYIEWLIYKDLLRKKHVKETVL